MRHTPDPTDRHLDLTGTKAAKPAPPPPPARQVSPGVFEVNGKFETRNPNFPMGAPVLPKLPHWGGWELLLGGDPEPHDRKGGPGALSELLKRKAEWVGSHPGASVAQIDAAHAAIAAEMGL